jgi:hypothetical protein
VNDERTLSVRTSSSQRVDRIYKKLFLSFHRLCIGFVLQKPGLALDTAAIAREGTIGSYHTMTRHHDANRVCAIGRTNGPDRRRSTNMLGELRVRDRGPAWDVSQRTPHIALKRRAVCLHRQDFYRR